MKAIASGADAVAMGRLYCYALAAEREAGVVRCSRCWSTSGVAMALAGARTWASSNPSFLHRNAPLVTLPHAHSAFPLLHPVPEYRG